MSGNANNEVLNKAIAAIGLHTETPVDIALAAEAVQEEDKVSVTLGTLDMLENFTSLVWKNIPGLGEVISMGSLLNNIDKARKDIS